MRLKKEMVICILIFMSIFLLKSLIISPLKNENRNLKKEIEKISDNEDLSYVKNENLFEEISTEKRNTADQVKLIYELNKKLNIKEVKSKDQNSKKLLLIRMHSNEQGLEKFLDVISSLDFKYYIKSIRYIENNITEYGIKNSNKYQGEYNIEIYLI